MSAEHDLLRLDRFLADAGLGSRSEVKNLIRHGRILVNGLPARDPKVQITADQPVSFDGKPVLPAAPFVYYLLNKPAGYLTATEDRQAPTVMDLIPPDPRRKLFPVGRLDKDTEGLLLITDDGSYAHELLSPVRHVQKTYYALVSGEMTSRHQAMFLAGMEIGEKKPLHPADLEILSVFSGEAVPKLFHDLPEKISLPTGPVCEIRLTIDEGKFHQVKHMVAAAGCEVLYLKRLSMGRYVLPADLRRGEWILVDRQ